MEISTSYHLQMNGQVKWLIDVFKPTYNFYARSNLLRVPIGFLKWNCGIIPIFTSIQTSPCKAPMSIHLVYIFTKLNVILRFLVRTYFLDGEISLQILIFQLSRV